jgi:cholesterol oxidase
VSTLDYDWIVIGSGFGGSVAALRLSEKGYRVGVLECGRRYEDHELAKSTWDWPRYVWMPRLGLKGILRWTPFKDITILSGSAVGGGSMVYANTLYRAPEGFFEDPQWAGLADWESELSPHYDTAENMLGAADVEERDHGDQVLYELARELDVEDTYKRTTVGVLFGEPGERVEDPYFEGEGPVRTACLRCGECMLGCRHGAKNTLLKNYLWLAERRGAEVCSERTVVDVAPLGAEDGSDGYRVASVHTGAWVRRDRRELTARGVVMAAGALGTNQLLLACREKGSLPRLSKRVGYLVRTNSEALVAVTATHDGYDFTQRVAITSSIYPRSDTHIETVTYGRGGNSMRLLFTVLTPRGTRITRPLKVLRELVRRPRRVIHQLAPGTWSRRTLILLVMQALDNHMRFRPRRRLTGGVGMQTEQDADNPNPTYIPAANDAAKRIARRIDGFAQSSLSEALANTPVTAHILGGAVLAGDPDHGVIDERHRAFGYEGLIVCDGSAVPANPGVNPSLTITAMAERAMTFVEPKEGAPPVPPVRMTAEAAGTPGAPAADRAGEEA